MNYALGSSFNLGHLSENFPSKKLKINSKQCKELTGDAHRINLAEKIFTANVKMVLEDVINDDVTFLLPTGARPSDIHMIKYDEDAFRLARKHGKFEDVDFLKSYFKGYLLGFFMYGNGRTRTKNIYVNKELKDLITTKTNEGFAWS